VERYKTAGGELAKRAALGRTSIYPALRELERAGGIEFIGAGRQRLVQLRDRPTLSRALRDLFRIEARWFEDLTVALRELLSRLPAAPISAWVDETRLRLKVATRSSCTFLLSRKNWRT
jgi:hypothetical protein